MIALPDNDEYLRACHTCGASSYQTDRVIIKDGNYFCSDVCFVHYMKFKRYEGGSFAEKSSRPCQEIN